MRKPKKQKIKIEYRPSSEAEDFGMTAVLREILQTGAVFVCLELAALWMLSDVFEELTISVQYLFQMFMAFFLLIIAAKISDGLARNHFISGKTADGSARNHFITGKTADGFARGHRTALWGKYVLPLAYAAGVLWYGIRYQEYLLLGGGAVVSSVLRKVNIYYGTSYLVLHQSEDKRELALIYVCVVLFLLVLTQTLAMRRRIFLMIPPVLVLILEMLVGRTPQTKSILLLFIGTLLEGWGDWEHWNTARSTSKPKLSDHMKGLIFPALVCLAVLVCMNVFSSLAAKLAANGEQVKVYQAKLESQAGRLFENIRNNNQSMVTNRTPEYTYEEVFTVSVTKLGTEDVYLRGFYGTDYLNGNWSDTTAEFDTDYAESDYFDANIVEIAGYSGKNQAYTLTIQYTNFDTTTVFVPYLLSADSLENCTVTGDYVVRKSRSDTEISYKYRNTDVVELVAYLDAEERASQDEQQWYADYVMEHYLDVPVTVTGAKGIADSIIKGSLSVYTGDSASSVSAEDFYLDSAVSISSEALSYLLSEASEEDATANTINVARIVAAESVQAYLQQWTYSLNLNKDTEGEDVIEYFLSESHTGYCVHYATAAALILREMGVPARYVSGYRVNRDDFALIGTEWTASVTDDMAHAWVEVYLEGFGWVPFEVSPGYGDGEDSQSQKTAASDVTQSAENTSENANTENGNSESRDADSGSEDWENTDSESENGDSTDSEGGNSENSENGSENLNSEDIESQIAEAQNQLSGLMENETENSKAIADLQNHIAALQDQQDALQDQRDEKEKAQKREMLLHILRIVGIIMLVIALIVLLLRTWHVSSVRRQNRWLQRLRHDMKSRHNRRAIASINTKIYRALRKKAGHRMHRPTDLEYGNLLAEHFAQADAADWARYVEIVQKAAFSKEDMLDEEAEFCYRMYKRL